jgi:hypothetical protein
LFTPDPDPDFYPSRIQGSKRQRISDPDPQHCVQTREAKRTTDSEHCWMTCLCVRSVMNTSYTDSVAVVASLPPDMTVLNCSGIGWNKFNFAEKDRVSTKLVKWGTAP